MNQQAQTTEIFTLYDEILPTEITKKLYDDNKLIIDYKQYYLYEKALCEMMETIKPKTEQQKLFINVIIELKMHIKNIKNNKRSDFKKFKRTDFKFIKRTIKIKPTSEHFNRYYNKKYDNETEVLNEIYRLSYLIKNSELIGYSGATDILTELNRTRTYILNEIKKEKPIYNPYSQIRVIKQKLEVLIFNVKRTEINDGDEWRLNEEDKLNKRGVYNNYIKDDAEFVKYKNKYNHHYTDIIKEYIKNYIYDNIEIEAIYNKTKKTITEMNYNYFYRIQNIKSYDKNTKKTSNKKCKSYNTNNGNNNGWYFGGIKTDDLKYILKENGFKAKDFKGKYYGDLVEMFLKL
jgi:hypothetical protein